MFFRNFWRLVYIWNDKKALFCPQKYFSGFCDKNAYFWKQIKETTKVVFLNILEI